MPNYGLYQLVNSREIPRFVGSPVPELSAVAQELQGRYDQATQMEDALDSTIGQTTSLQADAAMLNSLKTQYRNKLAERAKKGDYENMLRDVQRDAREFVSQYKPIAANQAAVSEYYKNLQERVEKGEVSKDWADRLYDASTRGYKGLQRNPVTGQLENQFKGITAVKNIDLAEWTDKALKGLKPEQIGSDVRQDEGGFYVTRGSTKEYLGMDRIRPALMAAMKTDPMFQAYAQQRAFLDSYKGQYMSEESVKNQPFYADVKKFSQEQGLPFNQALQQYFAQRSGMELVSEVEKMAEKYKVNNRTTKYHVDGETEATSRAAEDKASNTFMGMVQMNLPGTKLSTPGDLATAYDNLTIGRNEVLGAHNKFIRDNGVTVDRNGVYRDNKGRDVTTVVRKNLDIADQLAAQREDIKAREARVRKSTGFEIDGATEKAAREAYNKALNSGPYPFDKLSPATKEIKLAEAQYAYNNTLKQLKPAQFEAYKKALETDSKNSSVAVGVQRFKSKAANEAMENMVTILAQDLDIKGVKGGALGMQNMDGTPLTADDYKAVKGDTKFGGWFIDPADGKYKLVLKVGKVNVNSKGESVGETRLVKMDAPDDVPAYLIKTGQVDKAEQFVAQRLGMMEGMSENKTVDIPLLGDKQNIARVRRTQVSEQGVLVPKYELEFTIGGQQKVVTADTPGEVIESISMTMQNLVNKQTKK